MSPPQRQGVVGVHRRDEQFLVIRRAASVEAPGAFCFPGGGREGEETEEETLRREFAEELACTATPLRRLWSNRTDWEVDLVWWLVDVPTEETLIPNPAEVASVHWFTTEQLRALDELLSSNVAFLDAWARGEFEF